MNDMEDAVPMYKVNEILVNDGGNERDQLCDVIKDQQVSFIEVTFTF